MLARAIVRSGKKGSMAVDPQALSRADSVLQPIVDGIDAIAELRESAPRLVEVLVLYAAGAAGDVIVIMSAIIFSSPV